MAKSNPEILTVSGIEFKLIGKNLIGMIPLEKLVPYYRNPRHNSHAVPKVKASIAAFGMQQPLVVIPGEHEAAKSAAQDEFEIVVGHTRHLSCIELDYDPVPCILAKDLTDQQVAEYRIADNALNDLAEWNFEDLKMELESLQEMGSDFSLLGFSDGQLDLFMGVGKEKDAPEEFSEYDESIETKHECPKCGYKFS